MAGKNDADPRIFAIGDIHGCLDKLRGLMRRLRPEPGRDRLVFIGDYVNRGPDSRGVIEYLLEIGARYPGTTFLLGNHEHALLEYDRHGDVECLRLLRRMGVETALKSYNAPMEALWGLEFLPPEHRRFLESLRPYHRRDGFLFVHAGVEPDREPEHSPVESLLTARDIFLHSEPSGPGTVVFGHTSFETPLVAPGRIGIDTGAVYGNMLTAVELPRLRFFHA